MTENVKSSGQCAESSKEKALPQGLLVRLCYKNDQFSKTAMFASAANILVLISYVLSWAAGATFTIGEVFTFTIPAFDTSAALGLLTVINGTYLGNNAIKARSGA